MASDADARLHDAVSEGNEALVRALLAAGVEVDARDRLERTALHTAVRDGRVDLVRLLLAAGARPGVADDRGLTPLHETVNAVGRHGAVVRDLVSVLLAAGADPHARDVEGRTARALARRFELTVLVDALPPDPEDADLDPELVRHESLLVVATRRRPGRYAPRGSEIAVAWHPHDRRTPIHVQEGARRDEADWATSSAEDYAWLRQFLPEAGAGWFVPLLDEIEAGRPPTYAEFMRALKEWKDPQVDPPGIMSAEEVYAARGRWQVWPRLLPGPRTPTASAGSPRTVGAGKLPPRPTRTWDRQEIIEGLIAVGLGALLGLAGYVAQHFATKSQFLPLLPLEAYLLGGVGIVLLAWRSQRK